jgi:N-acetylmuramoyl-L-alanine amidase
MDDTVKPTRQVIQHIGLTLGVAALVATAFTAWTPTSLNPGEIAGELASVLEDRPTPMSPFVQAGVPGEPLRIGIVAGHAGPHPDTGQVDPGTICADGYTERELNAEIATRVAAALELAGLEVDILDEWDTNLYGYRAVALVSIHADSCQPINEYATGFKVAAAVDTTVPDRAQRLVDCMVDRYGQATGLRFHAGSITRDMTSYHTFGEIDDETPAVIIEVGFLYLDRELLTTQMDDVARGIAEGVLCYINNEPAGVPWE